MQKKECHDVGLLYHGDQSAVCMNFTQWTYIHALVDNWDLLCMILSEINVDNF